MLSRSLLLAFVPALTLSAPASAEKKVDAGRFGWLSSLAAGKAEARRSGKPMMVVVRCAP
jgi:hypothetical protein